MQKKLLEAMPLAMLPNKSLQHCRDQMIRVNPNDPDDEYGSTPFYWAAVNGHTEIVKTLAPYTENPNTPNKDGV